MWSILAKIFHVDIIKPLSKFPGNMREGHAKWLHENTIIQIRIRNTTRDQVEWNKTIAEGMFIILRQLYQRKYAGLLNMQMKNGLDNLINNW